MSRARFCAALGPARLDTVPGTVLSSRRQTMTNHGEAVMLFELGRAQRINQHAYPIYAWFRLRGRVVTEEGTIDDQAVVTQTPTYKSEERALGPGSFTHARQLQTSIPLAITPIGSGPAARLPSGPNAASGWLPARPTGAIEA
jgi:hypothetical protein